MKRLLFLFGFCFLFIIPMNAQDLIAKKSGEIIECRIVSSDGDKVRYVLK